ncbi:MAG: (2Fe-2S)-binding protein [Candidatus Riflebacteria bacterium]|nr:(2Fe-2S)-binding protein [Candidatus Riflebacteria bacterium]
MNKIIINGREVEFVDGERIIDAAVKAGIEIPLLCYSEKTLCGGKCMVCAVKNIDRNSFIPACTSICFPGMDLDTASAEVQTFRKAALELLLSEHQGSCEAPCVPACPQNIDFPAFFLTLKNGNNITEFTFNPEMCDECGGKCEKACRRGRIDSTVSIRELIRNACTFSPKENHDNGYVSQSTNKYKHHIGKLSREEIIEYFFISLPSDSHETSESINFTLFSELQKEAGRCLQCSCSARNNCILRNLASDMNAKQNRFRDEQPELMLPKRAGLITFYPGKCIRCHRCVELGKTLKPGKGPVMIGRGKTTTVDSPLNISLESAFSGFEEQFIDECPTGALSKS